MIGFFNVLYWQYNHLLWLLILPLFIGLFQYLWHRQMWRRLAHKDLVPWLEQSQSKKKDKLTMALLLIAWCSFVLALAGPRTVEKLPNSIEKPPASLVVIIDFSASMNAEDTTTSRKTLAIKWLISALKQKPEHLKIGIVLFAGHAFSLMPPTLDQAIIHHFAKPLETITLPTLGNNLADALKLAQKNFSPNDPHQRLLILTDGDLSAAQQKRAELAFVHAVPSSIIGFGGTQGVKIPNAKQGYVLDKGRPVQSRLQSVWLKQLSTLKHVTYLNFNEAKSLDLSHIIHLPTPRLNKDEQQKVIWKEWFSFPLGLGLFAFIISLWRSNKHQTLPTIATFMIFGLLQSFGQNVEASTLFDKAKLALKQQHYKQAQTLFNQSNNPQAAFGEGIACYRLADFNCAIRAFNKAAWQEKRPKRRANAVFNLANSYFFLAQYDQAAVLYDNAKKLGFDAQKANKNYQFTITLQRAVLKRIQDIKDVFRRAKWRAAMAGNPAPSLSNIIASQNNLSIPEQEKTRLFQQRKLINQLASQRLVDNKSQNNSTTHWVKTDTVAAQSTSHLLKRLFEMELAIPAPLDEPETIKGQRPW